MDNILYIWGQNVVNCVQFQAHLDIRRKEFLWTNICPPSIDHPMKVVTHYGVLSSDFGQNELTVPYSSWWISPLSFRKERRKIIHMKLWHSLILSIAQQHTLLTMLWRECPAYFKIYKRDFRAVFRPERIYVFMRSGLFSTNLSC